MQYNRVKYAEACVSTCFFISAKTHNTTQRFASVIELNWIENSSLYSSLSDTTHCLLCGLNWMFRRTCFTSFFLTEVIEYAEWQISNYSPTPGCMHVWMYFPGVYVHISTQTRTFRLLLPFGEVFTKHGLYSVMLYSVLNFNGIVFWVITCGRRASPLSVETSSSSSVSEILDSSPISAPCLRLIKDCLQRSTPLIEIVICTWRIGIISARS